MEPGKSLPPGPRAPSAWQSFAWQTRPIPYLERCRARYGKTFTLDFLGIDPFVMMSRPEDVKAIFTAPPDVLHSGERRQTEVEMRHPSSTPARGVRSCCRSSARTRSSSSTRSGI